MASEDIQPFQPLHGSCLCGLFTYTITAPPTKAMVCHCLSCRKWHGSAFAANLFFPLSSLQPSEESKPYIKKFIGLKGQTGNELRKTFCGECGSSMYVEAAWANVVSVARGSVVEGERLPAPETEYWVCRREGWVNVEGIRESFQKND